MIYAKELKFKAPTSLDQVQGLIKDSINELGFEGSWFYEYGYSINKMSSREITAKREKVNGFIRKGQNQITDFEVYAWSQDFFDEPMFAGIKFRATYPGFKEYNNEIYDVFEKQYNELVNKQNMDKVNQGG